jgi:hypothetical protein
LSRKNELGDGLRFVHDMVSRRRAARDRVHTLNIYFFPSPIPPVIDKLSHSALDTYKHFQNKDTEPVDLAASRSM